MLGFNQKFHNPIHHYVTMSLRTSSSAKLVLLSTLYFPILFYFSTIPHSDRMSTLWKACGPSGNNDRTPHECKPGRGFYVRLVASTVIFDPTSRGPHQSQCDLSVEAEWYLTGRRWHRCHSWNLLTDSHTHCPWENSFQNAYKREKYFTIVPSYFIIFHPWS